MGEHLFDNYLFQSLIQFCGSDADREVKTEEVFRQICRTCLCETADNNFEKNLLLATDCSETIVTVRDMIEISTGIKIDMDDKLPRNICNNCLQAVEAAFAFRTQSQRIDDVLKGFLPRKEEIVTATECTAEVVPLESERTEVIEVHHKINDSQVSFVINCLTDPSNEQCNICNMTFPNHTDLVNHIAENHSNPSTSKRKLFKCGLCAREFYFRNGLHNHMVVAHLQKKEFKCSVCFRKFKKRDKLERHKKRFCVPQSAVKRRLKNGPAKVTLHPVAENETPDDKHIEITNFSCSLCDETFELEIEFLNHLPEHKSKKCPLCKQMFSRVIILEGHVWSHGCERPYVCPHCLKGFRTTPGLRGHIKGHKEMRTFTDLQKPKPMLGVLREDEVFVKSEKFIVRELKTEPDLDLNEPDLSIPPEWKNDYKKSKETDDVQVQPVPLHALAELPVEIKQEILDDSQLNNTTNEPLSNEEPSSDQFEEDTIEAMDTKQFTRFTCEVIGCKMEFKYYTGMINHYTFQHCRGRPPFKCPVCSTEFPGKLDVREHVRSHLKCEYKCPFCVRVHSQLFELNAHMRTHTGERPFKCPQCPKTFKQRAALRVHKKTHNTSKEFKCQICSKEFFSYNGMFLHMKSHEVNTDLQCEFCKRQFPIKSRLQRHQKGICKLRDKKMKISPNTFLT